MRTCGLASDRFSARRTPLLLCTPCPNFVFLSSRAGTGQRGASALADPSHGQTSAPSNRRAHGGGVEVDNPLACFRSVRQCKQTVLDAGFAIPHWHELADSPPPAKRFQSPVNPRPDGNSGPPRSWNRSLCARRCGLLSANKGFDAFAARTLGFGTVDCARHVKGDPTRGPAVPRLPVSTFAPASLCPCAPADMASNLTCLGIIVQRVKRRGC